ncbi:sugar/nucleoside kinase (ribokinase family) [Streptomyces sp. V3I8]|uniref:carbohydrate kinase family protein n=1 Tax=Streptomyces sp. V3I8 TaxID=3042279 RepID=UPI0027864B8F|nr:PfkB family carbohydrate kinase [Streptomyces sp. V3I8]MDQ1034658.1 sugar/nucleoside kinase (ribokinase family) [Streptomyces sp. V3I8]
MTAAPGRRPRVVGLGLVMADVRVVCPVPLVQEHDPSVAAMDLRLGGATTNTLAALQRLGARTAVAGVVGDDWIGRFLLDQLDVRGVGREHVVTVPGSSPSCLVLESPPTRTLLWHLPARLERAAGTALRPLLPRLVEDADAVHVNGRFLPVAAELCALARERGITVSLNAGRGDVSSGVSALLDHADVLVAAEHWALAETGARTGREACERLSRRACGPPRLVSVTCGEHGSWTAGPGRPQAVHTRAPDVPPGLPTAGAGDAYHAGFLAAALAGAAPRRCARAGADEAGRHLSGAAAVPAAQNPPEDTLRCRPNDRKGVQNHEVRHQEGRHVQRRQGAVTVRAET